eukprot:153317_1
MIDLLGEIKSNNAGESTLSKNESNNSILSAKMSSDTVITISHTQSVFTPINDCISRINLACNRIDKLYGIKRTGMPSEQKKALKEVDQIILHTTPLIREGKKLLENAKANQIQNKRNKNIKKTDLIISQNMFNSCARNYQSAILRYQQSTAKFRSAVREDFTRQARIVDPQISQQQIQKMLESKDPAQYLQTHIMAISPQLLDEVAELEEEHERVKNLENTIEEIQELFNACALLVVQAGEKLDHIETNVEQTMTAAEKGKQELKKAEVYAVQTRKTKLKTAFFCIIVAIIVAVVVLLFLSRYI